MRCQFLTMTRWIHIFVTLFPSAMVLQPEVVIIRQPKAIIECPRARSDSAYHWFFTAKWLSSGLNGESHLFSWRQNSNDLEGTNSTHGLENNLSRCLALNVSRNASQELGIQFIPQEDCLTFFEVAINLELSATCVPHSAQNGTIPSTVILQLSTDFLENLDLLLNPDEDGYFPWKWWQGTDAQKLRYLRAKKRAFGFIFGMITPLGILLYIAMYLTCCRSSVDQNANMFGSESL